MLKRTISIVLLIITVIATITSCGTNEHDAPKDADDKKIKIVATIFPLYDWAKNIAGDDADVQLLSTNGVDMHSFQPTVDDIITLTDCDIFIYVGGNSDLWVNDAVAQSGNKDLSVINMMDLLSDSIKEEEIVPGMQAEDDEEEDDHHHQEIEYDEHIWLSVRNAAVACEKICDELCKIDSKNKDGYISRSEKYSSDLKKLDEKYSDMLSGTKRKTVLFGDRFPFRYLTDDYSIDYYAAFVGCSAESEASFETIIYLANKVDELSLPVILKIETSDGSIAEAIRNNTKNKDQEILTMNSMQSCSYTDIEKGVTYLQIMDENMSTLLKALS